MTTVVVNDASCLIDLHKGQLLNVMLTLPYRFVVPLPIRQAEALDLTDRDWQILQDTGLFTFDLPPELVDEATRIKTAHPKLSATTASVWYRPDARSEASCLPGSLLRKAYSAEFLPEAAGRARVSGRDAAFAGWQ